MWDLKYDVIYKTSEIGYKWTYLQNVNRHRKHTYGYQRGKGWGGIN